MIALFRGLMVPVSFVLFLALYGAVALAVVAAGPVALEGVRPEALPGLLPTGGGTPSPWVVAAGAALAVTLFVGMIAMLISERAETVGRFVRGCLKTSFWFAVIAGGGLALWLRTQPGTDPVRLAPAGLLAAGLLVAAVVAGTILGKPFLWWVSERPRRRPAAPMAMAEPSVTVVALDPVAPQAPETDPVPPATLTHSPSADAPAP
ncbi:hypothetical protein [Oharaeibacter diazotrophicus]|uniref:Uncharacterized protein n=1 Tax=Oharaeibacter diazotrophicus TaxID=1920512 RepID=A0A4R6RFQ5_9HYPH|nr:hypothetical protein [Oharaeibacter diazotrophicus]TDP85100.1 hypothetical protein EDD54_1945 [Oharaeibacter diazotrophicus]